MEAYQKDVLSRSYELALQLRQKGRCHFHPDDLVEKFKYHYGEELPFEQFGFEDAGQFLESSPLFFRMTEHEWDRRLRVYLTEDYRWQHKLPPDPLTVPPIIYLEPPPPEQPVVGPPAEEQPAEEPSARPSIRIKQEPIDHNQIPGPAPLRIKAEPVDDYEQQQPRATAPKQKATAPQQKATAPHQMATAPQHKATAAEPPAEEWRTTAAFAKNLSYFKIPPSSVPKIPPVPVASPVAPVAQPDAAVASPVAPVAPIPIHVAPTVSPVVRPSVPVAAVASVALPAVPVASAVLPVPESPVSPEKEPQDHELDELELTEDEDEDEEKEEEEEHQPVRFSLKSNRLEDKPTLPGFVDETPPPSPVREQAVTAEQETLVNRTSACLRDLYLQFPDFPCTLHALNKAFHEIYGTTFFKAFESIGNDHFSYIKILSDGEITCEKVHKTWHFGLKYPPKRLPAGKEYQPMDRPFKHFPDPTDKRDQGPIRFPCDSDPKPVPPPKESRLKEQLQITVNVANKVSPDMVSSRPSDTKFCSKNLVDRVIRCLEILEGDPERRSADGFYNLPTFSQAYTELYNQAFATDFRSVYPFRQCKMSILENVSNGRIYMEKGDHGIWRFGLKSSTPGKVAPKKIAIDDPTMEFGRDYGRNRQIMVNRAVACLGEAQGEVNLQSILTNYDMLFGGNFVHDCRRHLQTEGNQWTTLLEEEAAGKIQLVLRGNAWHFKLFRRAPTADFSNKLATARLHSSSNQPPSIADLLNRPPIKIPLRPDANASRLPATNSPIGIPPLVIPSPANQLSDSPYLGIPSPPDLVPPSANLDMPERLRQCLLKTETYRCDQKMMNSIYEDTFGEDLNVHFSRAYGTSSPEPLKIILDEMIDLFYEKGRWVYRLRTAYRTSRSTRHSSRPPSRHDRAMSHKRGRSPSPGRKTPSSKKSRY